MPWFLTTIGVLVEKGAGAGSGFSDHEYEKAGAILVDKAKDIWEEADMVVKVKEPLEPEFPLDETRAGSFHLSPSGC